MRATIGQDLLDGLRSDEEKHFAFWLKGALGAGLVEGYEYEERVYELFPVAKVPYLKEMKTRTVERDRHIHASESYTPDFVLRLTVLGMRMFAPVFRKSFAVMEADPGNELSQYLFVDVKGGYNPYQNDERYFSLVRKAMYSRYGVWVAKVIPFQKLKGVASGLFVSTWCPEEYRWVKRRREPTLTARGLACSSLEGFLKKAGAVSGSTVNSERGFLLLFPWSFLG